MKRSILKMGVILLIATFVGVFVDKPAFADAELQNAMVAHAQEGQKLKAEQAGLAKEAKGLDLEEIQILQMKKIKDKEDNKAKEDTTKLKMDWATLKARSDKYNQKCASGPIRDSDPIVPWCEQELAYVTKRKAELTKVANDIQAAKVRVAQVTAEITQKTLALTEKRKKNRSRIQDNNLRINEWQLKSHRLFLDNSFLRDLARRKYGSKVCENLGPDDAAKCLQAIFDGAGLGNIKVPDIAPLPEPPAIQDVRPIDQKKRFTEPPPPPKPQQ